MKLETTLIGARERQIARLRSIDEVIADAEARAREQERRLALSMPGGADWDESAKLLGITLETVAHCIVQREAIVSAIHALRGASADPPDQ